MDNLSTNRRNYQMFTVEEDEELLRLRENEGKDWVEISKELKKTPRQCREHYNYTLDQFRRRVPWTEEEDEQLIELVREKGHQWALLQNQFVGRSRVDLKNRYKYLEKRNSNRTITPFIIDLGQLIPTVKSLESGDMTSNSLESDAMTSNLLESSAMGVNSENGSVGYVPVTLSSEILPPKYEEGDESISSQSSFTNYFEEFNFLSPQPSLDLDPVPEKEKSERQVQNREFYQPSSMNYENNSNSPQIRNHQFDNTQFDNTQFDNYQFDNNQFGNNQFDNNQFGNNQFDNTQFDNNQFGNQDDNQSNPFITPHLSSSMDFFEIIY